MLEIYPGSKISKNDIQKVLDIFEESIYRILIRGYHIYLRNYWIRLWTPQTKILKKIREEKKGSVASLLSESLP